MSFRQPLWVDLPSGSVRIRRPAQRNLAFIAAGAIIVAILVFM